MYKRQFLDNRESANTDRYVFGKLSTTERVPIPTDTSSESSRQPRECQYRPIRLRKALGEMIPTPIFLAPILYCNCKDTEHGISPRRGVIYSVVYGYPLAMRSLRQCGTVMHKGADSTASGNLGYVGIAEPCSCFGLGGRLSLCYIFFIFLLFVLFSSLVYVDGMFGTWLEHMVGTSAAHRRMANRIIIIGWSSILVAAHHQQIYTKRRQTSS